MLHATANYITRATAFLISIPPALLFNKLATTHNTAPLLPRPHRCRFRTLRTHLPPPFSSLLPALAVPLRTLRVLVTLRSPTPRRPNAPPTHSRVRSLYATSTRRLPSRAESPSAWFPSRVVPPLGFPPRRDGQKWPHKFSNGSAARSVTLLGRYGSPCGTIQLGRPSPAPTTAAAAAAAAALSWTPVDRLKLAAAAAAAVVAVAVADCSRSPPGLPPFPTCRRRA